MDPSPRRVSLAGGLPLGHIAGVPVRAGWSLVVILAFVTFSLGEALGAVATDGSQRYALAVAAVLSVSFAASILAHEVGHAVVSQHYGVGVRRITLWLLGGMAELEGRLPSARASLAVAVAGPATSAVLGVAGVAGAWGLAEVGAPQVVVAGVFWLGLINAALAVFNMLPAAPLDGGRVLASVWWMITKSRSRGDALAGGAGLLAGSGLVGLGLWQATGGGFGDGWVLALMGAFVAATAGAERRVAKAGLALGPTTAGQAMAPAGDPVRGWMTISAADQELGGGAPVLVRDFGGGLVGVYDPGRGRALEPDDRHATTVAELTVPLGRLASVGADEPLAEVAWAAEHSVVVVRDGGDVVGLVGPRQLDAAIARRSGELL